VKSQMMLRMRIVLFQLRMRPLQSIQSCPRSRKTNILTAGILLSISRIALMLHCVRKLSLTQRLGKRGCSAKVSDLEDREYTLILIKRAMDSCHPLKLLNLAARFHIHTCGVFYIQLALKAGTLIQNIKVWLISILPHCPCAFSACFLSFCAKYDK